MNSEEAIGHVVRSVEWNLTQDENEQTKEELFEDWVVHINTCHGYEITTDDRKKIVWKLDILPDYI